MKVKIDIETFTFVRFWLVVIGFGLAILGIYMARTALLLIGISFFLALALSKPVSYIEKRLPGENRVIGSALAFLAVIIVLGSVITLVVPPIIEQTAKFSSAVPSLIEQSTSKNSMINDFVEKHNLQPQIEDIIATAKERTAGIASNVGQMVLSGLSSFAAFITGAIIVLVMTYLMLVEGPRWIDRLWGLYDEKSFKRREHHKHTLKRMYEVVTSYIIGQLTVSGIGALCSGAFVFLLSFFFDVPSNLALPVIAITFVLSLIPMFGATIAGVLITLLLLMNNLTAAIFFAVYFVIYQQVENNFISPTIQSKRIDLTALVVLMSVTIGTYLFGILGGIISIPIAGCIKVLIEEYLVHRRRIKSEKPKGLLPKIMGDAATK